MKYAVVRGQGVAKWWQSLGDTPTGEYTGEIEKTQFDKEKYGKAPYVRMSSATSGHAKEAEARGRSGLLIHAGREEPRFTTEREVTVIEKWNKKVDKDGKVTWEPVKKKEKRKIPYITHGCLRVTQDDLDGIMKAIECCIKKGDAKNGKITIRGKQEEAPQ